MLKDTELNLMHLRIKCDKRIRHLEVVLYDHEVINV